MSTSGGEPYRLTEPDASIGELVGRLTKDFGQLVSTHIELAKVETREELKRAGKGAGLLGAAAVAGLLTLILLSFAAAWGLAEVMPTAVAFLIVGVIWAIGAGVLAARGRKEITNIEAAPQTVAELKEDRRWMNEQHS